MVCCVVVPINIFTYKWHIKITLIILKHRYPENNTVTITIVFIHRYFDKLHILLTEYKLLSTWSLSALGEVSTVTAVILIFQGESDVQQPM